MNIPSKSSVPRCTLWIVLAAATAGAALLRADDGTEKKEAAASKAEKQRRAAYVGTMQAMTREFKVIRLTDNGEVECDMVKESVLNWADHSRHPDLIIPGTTWIWHHNGRPQVIGEIYGRIDLDGQWFLFACTLSSNRLKFSDGANMWTPTTSYYDPKEIPNAPAVAKTKLARTFQMNKLASRFDAHQFWEGRFQLRLLPHSIHRYEDTDAGIIDGAVYALVHGTNPEVILLIEAHVTDDGPVCWMVGFGSLAGARCVVRLDGAEFWTCPLQMGDPADPRHGFNKAVPVVGIQATENQ
jgi:hypothetical protein